MPLSQQAYDEFLSLQDICLNANQRIQDGEKDKWSYIWGSETFSCSKAYKVMIGYQPVLPHFFWIWNSSCQSKHKIFFWLLLHDRLNTRNLLRRKISSCNHTTVLHSNVTKKRHSCIFSGLVLLLRDADILYAHREPETYLFMKLLLT